MDDAREQGIRSRYEAVAPYADERVRRRLAGAESIAYGRGGVSAVRRPLRAGSTRTATPSSSTSRPALRDRGVYPTGIKVTKRELADLRVLRDDFHPEWNYTLAPTNA